LIPPVLDRRCDRQVEGENASFAKLALGLDVAAVGLNYRTCDRQTDPRAAIFA
jgi:hypothetical protein